MIKAVAPVVSPAEYKPRNVRRILLVFPRYAHSFGTFQHAYGLLPGVRAFMPPQGILVLAAAMPASWEVRFVDENLRHATDDDYRWAEAVFISGMHVQRTAINRINAAAQRHGRITVLGGPSVSACPAYYPDVDVLHVGELGDATVELVRMLDACVDRPTSQVVLETSERLPLEKYPCPAYHLIDMRRYFLGSIQFSSGCPFLCEFCDIPALYGRKPRMKTPRQVIAELDRMLEGGLRSAVYFVDDNFIANPAAARELLPHLIDWQKQRGYRLKLCCEATLNLAQFPDILQMMREAYFTTVFCGIETPEPEALRAMHKTQNQRQPILEAVKALNDHGMEVVSGIILGLDTDTPATADNILEFIRVSRIPMLTINLLYALPKTKLHERLSLAGRLIDDPERQSNVDFKMPYEQVLNMWRRVIAEAYEPRSLLERFRYQTEACFPNRIVQRPQKVTMDTMLFGFGAIARTMFRVGYMAEWRRLYWDVCGPLLRQGRMEEVMHIAVVSHHLITFSRECADGIAEASFYADPSKVASDRFAPQTV